MTRFLHSSDSCKRADTDAVWNDTFILPIGASISICAYFLIFYLYYYLKVPTLKRHPTCESQRQLVQFIIYRVVQHLEYENVFSS